METISIGQSEHQIEVKPITLICKNLIEDVKYKDRLPLDLEACLFHIERCKTFHTETEKLLKMIFKNWEGNLSPEIIKEQGFGFKHMAGRIDLTLKLMDQNTPVAWVYPESGLHPSSQAELADVIIYLTKRVVK